MANIYLEVIAALSYTILLNLVWNRSVKEEKLPRYVSAVLVATMILHGYISYINIDQGGGQNFGLFNILNMTTWISMLIVLWNLFRYKTTTLLVFTLPLAIISILAVSIFDGNATIYIKGNGFQILHILLGIIAMGILLLAATQSALVLYIDNKLRNSPSSLTPVFDSLQSLERYLYQLLISGFILMTGSLILVTFFSSDSLDSQVLHKVVLTIASWFILAALVLGHFLKGWRGVFAAKWTLIGVFLLLLGYFGSKLVQEFIIG